MTTTGIAELQAKGRAARGASKKMALLSTEIKNRALNNIASALEKRQKEVLRANQQDYDDGRASGMAPAMLDRLLLHPQEIVVAQL